ncbi:MAG: MraY family glycosyltransferase [Rikenellaceae bacterium]
MILSIISFIISSLVVAYMLPQVMLLSLRKRLIDPIDVRKIHNVTASRLGGFTFFPAIILAVFSVISYVGITDPGVWSAYMNVGMTLEVAALMLLYLVGLFDDIMDIAYRTKFVVQIIASLLVVVAGVYFKDLHGLFGIYEIPSYVGIPITLFFLVFVMNSVNLIDGIDGLASLLSIMALGVYAWLFVGVGMWQDCIMSCATLGALVPFCYSNIMGIRKGIGSKIFMGDAGALVIGAILGFMAIKLWDVEPSVGFDVGDRSLAYVLAYTMLIIPCFDVVRVVFHRARFHKPLFLPDKNHIHHKLMDLGASPRMALMQIILINIFFLVFNIVLYQYFSTNIIIICDVVVWTLFQMMITRMNKKKIS